MEVVRDPGVGPRSVRASEVVTAHYIGMLADGRLFDTYFATVADDARIPLFASFQKRPRGDSFEFTPGLGVIQGFTDLAVGTREGATATGAFPPAKAYGMTAEHPLGGRTLLFQLEIVDIR